MSKKFSELSIAPSLTADAIFAIVDAGTSLQTSLADVAGTTLTEALATRISTAGDKGKRLRTSGASAVSYTLTNGVHSVGDTIELCMGGTGVLTLVEGANVTINLASGASLVLEEHTQAALVCESVGGTDIFTLKTGGVGGGGGTPGGPVDAVQVNTAGAFAGYAGFQYHDTSRIVEARSGSVTGIPGFAISDSASSVVGGMYYDEDADRFDISAPTKSLRAFTTQDIALLGLTGVDIRTTSGAVTTGDSNVSSDITPSLRDEDAVVDGASLAVTSTTTVAVGETVQFRVSVSTRTGTTIERARYIVTASRQAATALAVESVLALKDFIDGGFTVTASITGGGSDQIQIEFNNDTGTDTDNTILQVWEDQEPTA